MPRPILKMFMSMDSADNKRRLIASIGTLRGEYEVDIQPRRTTRSLAQNRWYRGSIAAEFAKYLAEQEYDGCSPEQAHRIMADKFLRVPLIDKSTGEEIGHYVRSTTELSTVEMMEYCERCRVWLADMFFIVISDPDPAYATA